MPDYPLLAQIRDVVIIIWGVLGILTFLVVLLLATALFRGFLPVLKSLRVTTANVQASSTLIADIIIKPIIRTSSFFIGLRKGAGVLARLRQRPWR